MKSVWALVFMAVCALLFVAFQAIQQEIKIRKMGKIILSNTEEVKAKEYEILNFKGTLQKLSSQLDPLDKQNKQLTQKMQELMTQKENAEQNINTCQMQKTEVEQQKSEKVSAVEMLRTSQDTELQKVQEEIQSLRKQILDRDLKICTYVDKGKEEGVKLCAEKTAASNV